MLLVVDDLQHGDRETCQLLHYLLRVAPDARCWWWPRRGRRNSTADHPVHDLLAGLRARDRLDEIELARARPAPRRPSSPSALTGAVVRRAEAQRLYAETEGNPLFVVEALRAGWTPARPLSPRVQSVIEARLAQLSDPARDLVAVAAMIGREFTIDVLAARAGSDEDALVRGLDELWRRRIVREQGGGRDGAATTSATTRSARSPTSASRPARRRHAAPADRRRAGAGECRRARGR